MTPVITPENLEHAELLKQSQKSPENPKMGAIFGEKGMSAEQLALANTTSAVSAKLRTLRDLHSLNPTEAREKEMIDLERQRGRVARYAFLQKGATPEQKEILKDKETLEKLRASDVLLLKKKGVDLSNLLLIPV